MPGSSPRLTVAVATAVAAGGLLIPPAAAAPVPANHLLINEVYGGGGNSGALFSHDFVELHNPTTEPIEVGGLSLQYRAAANGSTPGSSGVFALPSGTVAPGGTYLVQLSPGNNTSLPALPGPNAASTGTTMNLAGANGQIFLVSGTTALNPGAGSITHASVIDFVGFGTAASYEGTGAANAPSNSTSISRKVEQGVVVDTNDNAADFDAPAAPSPRAADVVATPLAFAGPGDRAVTVGIPATGLSLEATGGTAPYTYTATGLPAGLTLDASTGAVSGTAEAVGVSTVTATVTDAATPAATITVEFTVTVEKAPEVLTIAEVQGTGERSPLAPATGNTAGDDVVAVEGVVTATYPTGGINGFFVQTAGTGGTKRTSDASDGLFVYGTSGAREVSVGDSVRVTGRIGEFWDHTQINPVRDGVVELDEPLAPVTPLEVNWPATDAERELLEGMLLAPQGDFTVSNAYSANQYAEIGLAAGTEPLKQPTEHVHPSDAAGIAEIRAENAARMVGLDDGATVNYLGNNANKALPTPYLTNADGSANGLVRVGAQVTFNEPVVLDWRNSAWKFQPTRQITTNGADVVSFSDTRASNLAPQPVGGDLKIASFNVLNYFSTTGEEYAASGAQQNPPIATHCTYYNDRQSNRIGNNNCGVKQPGESYTSGNPNDGRGPRGAATAESLARQEAKLVNTINTLDADVIALEEIENSIKLPGKQNRDEAVAKLVRLLNEANPGTWAYVRSPGSAMTAAAVAEQDVIRSAFIYKRESVEPVGQSEILFGTNEFANMREPLAQAFKAKGAPDTDAFGVIGNHFKSKGDNSAPGAPAAIGDNANDSETGVGAFNGDRIRAAAKLVEFADEFSAARDVEAVFLAGDFNAYSMEEPIKVLERGGFSLLKSDQAGDHTYSYQGLSGSLDHVLGNAAAVEMVTGSDVWEINSNESAAFQYSRHNYNVTDFFQPELPFATSDHNPHVVGIDVPDFEPTSYSEVAVLATNDFHGRLLPDAGNAAGAAPFATALDELREQHPANVFVAAGDLVGASTFESFISKDEPTIDALNAMGLEVSAAGNHEFDGGYEDLVGRIKDRADWEYIAANVVEPEGRDELAETWTTVRDGVKLGFVGAVTEDLPALVSPSALEGVTVTDVVEATNAAAAKLKAEGADVVTLLVHEGSSSTSCLSPTFTDPATTWGNIVQNTSADVDAIVSGHTHLAYNCRYTVEEWADEKRDVTRRPVVSAGQYGTNINELVFKFDTATDSLVAIDSEIVAAAGVGHAPRADVAEIVDAAVEHAHVAGSEVLGHMDAAAMRATYRAGGDALENRGGESVLGNLVAEAQRWSTDADIAFMNPGGLRADMAATAAGATRALTYRQAADVQPFANTLVTMELTGAQIRTVLEQQWQRNALGGVPSRPFQRLGVSEGFTYTYSQVAERVAVPNAAPVETFAGTVTGMWLDGAPIKDDATYTVAANSFLGGGGDNFWELANGTKKVDTGKIDLASMVDYMAQFTDAAPLDVDTAQRAVQIEFAAGTPTAHTGGETVTFDVSSWAMTGTGDVVDSEIKVAFGDVELGTFAVDNSAATAPYDTAGTASVSVVLPADLDAASALTLTGAATGTVVRVPLGLPEPEVPQATFEVEAPTAAWNAERTVTVVASGTGDVTGTVVLRDGEREIARGDLVDSRVELAIPAGTLTPGTHELEVTYTGNHTAAAQTVRLVVGLVTPEVTVSGMTSVYGRGGTVTVTVADEAEGRVRLLNGRTEIGAGEVVDGRARIILTGRALRPGTRTVTVAYSGDERHTETSTTVSVKIAQATPKMTVSLPAKARVRVAKPVAKIRVTATAGVRVVGKVKVSVKGQKARFVTLKNGRAQVRLAAFRSTGAKKVTLSYRGSELLKQRTITRTVRITR